MLPDDCRHAPFAQLAEIAGELDLQRRIAHKVVAEDGADGEQPADERADVGAGVFGDCPGLGVVGIGGGVGWIPCAEGLGCGVIASGPLQASKRPVAALRNSRDAARRVGDAMMCLLLVNLFSFSLP